MSAAPFPEVVKDLSDRAEKAANERDQARHENRRLRSKLRARRCQLCGGASNGPLCWAHSDLAGDPALEGS